MTGMTPGNEEDGGLDTGALEALFAQINGATSPRQDALVADGTDYGALRQRVTEARANRPNELLIQLGLGMMASRSPSFLGAVGEAGQRAIPAVRQSEQAAIADAMGEAKIGGLEAQQRRQQTLIQQQEVSRQQLRRSLSDEVSAGRLQQADADMILSNPQAQAAFIRQRFTTPRAPTTVTTEQGVFERDPNSPTGLGRRLGDRPNNAPQVVMPKLESAYAQTRGTDLAKEVQNAAEAAAKSRDSLASVETLSGLLGQIQTGALTPGAATLGAALQSVGINPERLGIDPNLPATAQAAGSIISRLTMDMIGPGGIPAQGFSNADREFLTKAQVSLANRPEANELLLEIARRKARRTIDYQRGLSRADSQGVDDVRRFKQEWEEYADKNPAFVGLTLPGGRQAGGDADKPPPNYTAEQQGQIKRARDAIARGAPRDAIAKRLRDLGVEPPGDL